MRDLINDLEEGAWVSDPDPVRRARNQMKQPLPKRFYAEVSVEPAEGGYGVRLDGKPVLTPAKTPLVLPTSDAAQLVADEFAAQGELIDLPAMPVLRLANTAIDGVASFPEVMTAIRDAISDPAATPTSVGRAVERDVAFASRLLRIVNAPAVGLIRPCASVPHAVTLVGLQRIGMHAEKVASLAALSQCASIAPEVTTTTSTPARCSAATSSVIRATTESRSSPLSSATIDDPSLTTATGMVPGI